MAQQGLTIFSDHVIPGTGDHPDLADYEIVKRRFAIYTITIKLTWDGKFVEIMNIKINK